MSLIKIIVKPPWRTLIACIGLLSVFLLGYQIWTPGTVIRDGTHDLKSNGIWLGTVPLTSGLVAQIFGPRYMTMLFGIVFLSHQIGAFIGVWLGGYLFDTTGSYILVWWLSVALGILAATLHLPIDESPVALPETAK